VSGLLLPFQAGLPSSLEQEQVLVGQVVQAREERSSSPAAREKAPALSSRRGRARRTSEYKGGRRGGSRVRVPSPDPSSCFISLSFCPRPTSIWKSGADCAASFRFGRKS
jgi:hypothetical protein